MKILKQVKVLTYLLIIWQKYDNPLTTRSETHVLLSIKNEASHWLAIWTVCSTLTYCERTGETLISSVIQNNQIIHNFTIYLLSASMFVILPILTAADFAQALLIQNSLYFFSSTLQLHWFASTTSQSVFGFKESMKSSAVLLLYLLCWTGQSWAGLSASLH